MKLYIANKNYSSWSMRPWIAMRAKRLAFEEVLVPFEDDAGNPKFREFSPSGKVPCLVDNGVTIWDSLAILEYLDETAPGLGFWPDEAPLRAVARSVSAEMHSGFGALRSAAPMNIRRKPAAIPVTDAVRRDVARIEEIWQRCLDAHGGPFLFGSFSNADAMYAPVVNRLEVYLLSDHPAVKAYSAAIKAHPAWIEWETAARAETWIVPADEV
jgi:glutathione S-transferase